jgi:flagellar hook assembly protein FlgD
VSLRIYNVLGQEVVTLLEGAHPAGNYQAVWDGRNEAGESVGSGVYFYRLEASSDTGENFASLRKMILMK